MFFLWKRLKILVEPTGVLAAAALLEEVVNALGARIGVIISGGNVDLAARKEAQRRGLPVIGTVGIMLIAKQQGLIPCVKEVLDDLTAKGA